jgi:hypothetical protein
VPSKLHATRFWLGVVVKNLSSDDPYVAYIMLETINWFLWHFTASVLPAYLRWPLIRTIPTILERLDTHWYKFPFSTRECTEGEMRQRHTAVVMLLSVSVMQYLIATDEAMMALGVRMQEDPGGKNDYMVRTTLLLNVRRACCSLSSNHSWPHACAA